MTVAMVAPPIPTDALARLGALLDLSMIRMKLADPEEGKGYSEQELDLREGEYRKFLALHMAFPEMTVVPCQMVDEFWHQHILDTMAYRIDCERIFGRFLEHFPYFGLRGLQDAQDLSDAYEDTLVAYRKAFGEPPDGTWVSGDARTCRTKCKPMKCK
jgi:hypothetical protein